MSAPHSTRTSVRRTSVCIFRLTGHNYLFIHFPYCRRPNMIPESSQPLKRYKGQPVVPELQAAIYAAVSTGRAQKQVAKDFGVHPNTVCKIVARVREEVDSPANPLSGFRDVLRSKAVTAVESGLDCKKD